MTKILFLLPLSVLLHGCTFYDCSDAAPGTTPCSPMPVKATQVEVSTPVSSSKEVVLRTLGYATVHRGRRTSEPQQRLLAMRAAKMEAMRAMAERLYGFHIQGESSASGMKIADDSFRTVVNAYLRGAEVVGVSPMDDDTYEAVVELKVTEDFLKRLGDQVSQLDDRSGQSFYYSD